MVVWQTPVALGTSNREGKNVEESKAPGIQTTNSRSDSFVLDVGHFFLREKMAGKKHQS